jgi:predicted RNase H-like nuclease
MAQVAAGHAAGAGDVQWYYRGLVQAFAEKGPVALRRVLVRSVEEMERLLGPIPRRAHVLGVDGAPGGWVAVRLGEDCSSSVAVHRTFEGVLASAGEAEIIAVDIPIGLDPAARRTADEAARRFLGRHASRVFLTPARRLLELSSYQLVREAVAAEALPGVSAQSYALRAKIFEVDVVAGDGRLREIHPEVSFRAMNGDRDLLHGKKTRDGFAERMSLLRRNGIWIDGQALAVKDAGADDILDAGAAAWSARRIASRIGLSVPAQPAEGEHGRPIAIWD